MTPKLEIESKEIGAVLICGPQGSPSSQYFVAHLRTLELDARTRVYAFQPKAPGVAEFFRSMAKKWRGWSGTLSYDSLEGEFGLAGIHDGLGHITLVVKIAEGSYAPPRWTVRAQLRTEAGMLESLADAAEKFEAALSTTA